MCMCVCVCGGGFEGDPILFGNDPQIEKYWLDNGPTIVHGKERYGGW